MSFKANLTDKLTFPSALLLLLLTASIFDGMTQGIMTLQETIAKKALSATDLQITMIGIITSATVIFSLLITHVFANRNKTWLLVIGFVAGRLVFVLSPLIRNANIFLFFLFLYHALFAVQIPIFNSYFLHFFAANRGIAFGFFRSIQMLFVMIAALLAGKFMDHSPEHFQSLLLIIALTSTVVYMVLLRIESGVTLPTEKRPLFEGFHHSLRRIVRHQDFIVFETAFMIYGFAFMICVPTVPLFLLKVLKLSYFEMAQAQGVYSLLFIMLTLPFAGRLFDRINLWKVAAVSFGILILYPSLFIGSYLTQSKLLAYSGLLVYSLGLSGVIVLWNLGSYSFAQSEDAFVYQGFHLTLTGIRGVLGPLLGYFLLSRMGFTTNFLLAGILFLFASLLSWFYGKNLWQQDIHHQPG